MVAKIAVGALAVLSLSGVVVSARAERAETPVCAADPEFLTIVHVAPAAGPKSSKQYITMRVLYEAGMWHLENHKDDYYAGPCSLD